MVCVIPTTIYISITMELTDPPFPRKPGRPPAFDRAAALHAAMLEFWRHGYETSSVAGLTAAMGISAPSLYNAFGDKQQLFLAAVQLYAGDPIAGIAAAPSALTAAHAMLMGAATLFTGTATPPGCLLASASASGSNAAAPVQQAIATIRKQIAQALQTRIEQDTNVGILAPGTNAAALAALMMAVVQGMSVLARDGADRARLLAVADAALTAWPTRPA